MEMKTGVIRKAIKGVSECDNCCGFFLIAFPTVWNTQRH